MRASDYISVLAVMISVVAGWKAYGVSARTHETMSFSSGTELFMLLNQAFIDHPEARPYFYDGKALTDGDPLLHQVHAIAEMMLDVFDWIFHRREGLSASERTAWSSYVGHMLALSPALREYHLAHCLWHPTVDEMYFPGGRFTATPGAAPPPRTPA